MEVESSTTNSSDIAKPARRAAWFRFSLLTILLLTTIVALTVSHISLSRERAQLQATLDDIRRDNQVMEVRDRSKVHVLPSNVPFTQLRQWRVYLPEGSDYHLCTEARGLGQPQASTSRLTLSSGFHTIWQIVEVNEILPDWSTSRMEVRSDLDGNAPQNRNWYQHKDFQLPADCAKWLSMVVHRRPKYRVRKSEDGTADRIIGVRTAELDVHKGLRQFDVDEKISLIRHEAYDNTVWPVAPEDDGLPHPFFQVWIERAPAIQPLTATPGEPMASSY